MSDRDLEEHYRRNGQDPSSASNYGAGQASKGQQSSAQHAKEAHAEWAARQDAYQREQERLSAERKRNGY